MTLPSVSLEDDDILDALFHACAWRAYLEQAQAEQSWPDPEATRRRAYDYYERALAQKNARAPGSPHPPGRE